MSIDVDGLRASLEPVNHPPSLETVNLSGTTMIGSFRIAELSPLYFTLSAFIFIGIPLFPGRVYLVEQPFKDSYRFFGQIKRRDFRRVCPEGMRRLGGAYVFQTIMMLFFWGMIWGGVAAVLIWL